jgi:CO/xanthine dehydrogenase Mo-binding subunit
MVYRSCVGARIKRKEDPRLMTGDGSYVDDLWPRGLLYAEILRSPYAGQALWEEVLYDESGQLVTGSLTDYAVPVAE